MAFFCRVVKPRLGPVSAHKRQQPPGPCASGVVCGAELRRQQRPRSDVERLIARDEVSVLFESLDDWLDLFPCIRCGVDQLEMSRASDGEKLDFVAQRLGRGSITLC